MEAGQKWNKLSMEQAQSLTLMAKIDSKDNTDSKKSEAKSIERKNKNRRRL